MPFILITIFIILCILSIILTCIAWSNYNTGITYTTDVPSCSISLENSLDITNFDNCHIGGYITASKYVPQLDMTVNTVETYYLNVCAQYCSNGFDGVNCIDGINQESFDNCISISKPVNCSGLSNPVAISGITFYYPYAAKNICD